MHYYFFPSINHVHFPVMLIAPSSLPVISAIPLHTERAPSSPSIQPVDLNTTCPLPTAMASIQQDASLHHLRHTLNIEHRNSRA